MSKRPRMRAMKRDKTWWEFYSHSANDLRLRMARVHRVWPGMVRGDYVAPGPWSVYCRFGETQADVYEPSRSAARRRVERFWRFVVCGERE